MPKYMRIQGREIAFKTGKNQLDFLHFAGAVFVTGFFCGG